MFGTDVKIFSGNANKPLATSVAEALGTSLGSSKVSRFSDGEVEVEIQENVRGRDVFLIQPTSTPVNDHLMELLIMVDACKRASAARITAVIPYYGYARQDRKVAPRAPITAKLVADMLTAAGIHRALLVDIHSGQEQGFFDLPVDNLYSVRVLADAIRPTLPWGADKVVVSPDAGGVARARSMAKLLETGLAIVDKRRSGPNQSEVMNVVGDVRGKHAIIFDDMIDTAGTLVKAAQALVENGALTVRAAASHGVLSGSAVERIDGSPLEAVYITDTIQPTGPVKACNKIKVVTMASLIADAIRAIHNEESISRLFP